MLLFWKKTPMGGKYGQILDIRTLSTCIVQIAASNARRLLRNQLSAISKDKIEKIKFEKPRDA